jgi:hypothetical protein
VKLSRAAIAAYVCLVFASGGVLGVFGTRLYLAQNTVHRTRPNPEEQRKRYIAEFESRLKLSPQQVLQLNNIMDETKAGVDEIRRKQHPEYQKIHEEQSKKMHNMLTPDQQVEFDKMMKEREQNERKNGGRGPGGI